MNVRDAKRILGPYMPGGAVTQDSVRSAFAEAVKALHPDSRRGDRGDVNSQWTMHQLKESRELLLGHYSGPSVGPASACPVCRGSGWQSIGMRRVPCVKGCDPA